MRGIISALEISTCIRNGCHRPRRRLSLEGIREGPKLPVLLSLVQPSALF